MSERRGPSYSETDRVEALIGWFVDTSMALAIFPLLPIAYVVRVGSAEHRESD